MKEVLLDEVRIKNDLDAVKVRQVVRRYALELGFSMITQTKIATVASELARNIINYAKEGKLTLYRLIDVNRNGLKLVFEDNGPGIPDLEKALKEGYSSTMSLGMGLSISKKFSNYFKVESEEGKGTKVTVVNWVKSNERGGSHKIRGPAGLSRRIR